MGIMKAFINTNYISNNYHYSNWHDYNISNYHRPSKHLQTLGIGWRQHFKWVNDGSWQNFKEHDNSSSTLSRNDFDQFPRMPLEEYWDTGTQASNYYGYDQSFSSSRIGYWSFGYYQYGVKPKQPPK